MKNKALIILFTCLFSIIANAQNSHDTLSSNKTCIVGFWPSKVTKVNGIMLNVWPKDGDLIGIKENLNLPTTNGLELILNPVGPITAGMIFFHLLLDKKARNPSIDSIGEIKFEYFKKVNGLQIGLVNMEPTITSGIEINLTGSYESKINGLSIGIIANERYILNGVGIGLLGNFDTEVNGIQIGLLNKTNKLKGLQIGLWNKNQKRSLPFVNWNF